MTRDLNLRVGRVVKLYDSVLSRGPQLYEPSHKAFTERPLCVLARSHDSVKLCIIIGAAALVASLGPAHIYSFYFSHLL